MKVINYKKKKKMHNVIFLFIYLVLTLVVFSASILLCYKIHKIYYGHYFTDIIWTSLLFFMPAIITILVNYIIFSIIFRHYYLYKTFFRELKEILGYISVFLLIIINTTANFYSSKEDKDSKSFIEIFFKLTIEEVNYIYTLPILLSVSTISMYIYEKDINASISTRKVISEKKVGKNVNGTIITPNTQRCIDIVNDIRKILEESRKLNN